MLTGPPKIVINKETLKKENCALSSILMQGIDGWFIGRTMSTWFVKVVINDFSSVGLADSTQSKQWLN